MGKAILFWILEMLAMFIVATLRPNVLEWNTFAAGMAFSFMSWIPALMIGVWR